MDRKIKITLTKGMQASGKSWWAKEFIKNNQDWKRVNRDLIRHQLSAYTFDDKNEKLVTLVEENTIDILINQGYNVIIDSMNLNKERLEKRIDEYVRKYKELDNIDIEVEIKSFPIEINEAIIRDKLRDFSLGEKVLKRTWHKYKNELIEMIEESKVKIEYNPNLPDCLVCDIDGTLALRGSRSPYDFTKVKEDKINESIRNLILSIKKSNSNLHLFIFSGRDDICKTDTLSWLIMNNIVEINDLVMRKTGDNRKDAIVKEEMYRQHIEGKYNCLYWIDDRKQVIDHIRNKIGITVLDVAGNTF